VKGSLTWKSTTRLPSSRQPIFSTRKTKDNSKIVVITTYDTFANRHGPAALEKSRIDMAFVEEAKACTKMKE
jgi:hypothetical protein